MSHNYKISDFRIDAGIDTDINERIVSIDLSNVKELPIIIVQRLETLINKMIEDHEKEHNTTVPMDKVDLGMFMDIDTQEHTLSLNAYVGYSSEEECIVGKEVMTAADEDYSIMKKYFFSELSNYIFEQVRRIQGCVA